MYPKIIACEKVLPKHQVSNDQLSEFVDTSDEWISQRTGIKQRYFLDKDESIIDLAYLASIKAINKAQINFDDIDVVIVSSMSQPYLMPISASLIASKLGLDKKDVFVLDINAACSGYIYGLEVIDALMQQKHQCGLLITLEQMSKLLDFNDRSTCVLFGDGVAATVLDKSGSYPMQHYSNFIGDNDLVLNVKFNNDFSINSLQMNGSQVFRFAIKAMQEAIEKILQTNNLTFDDIDLIIPHQANIRIIEKVSKLLNINLNKFYLNLDKYGNTSSASIPLALSELDLNKYQRMILVGFGGGLTYGACLIER